jgi:hypothetical protein
MATTTQAGKRYSVIGYDGAVISTHSRKDQATTVYELSKDVACVTSPGGKVLIGTMPAGANPNPTPEKESDMATATATKKAPAKKAAAKKAAAPKAARQPKDTAGKECSLKRLQGWADKFELEVINGERVEGAYHISLQGVNGTGKPRKFEGATARAAYGEALTYLKGLKPKA